MLSENTMFFVLKNKKQKNSFWLFNMFSCFFYSKK